MKYTVDITHFMDEDGEDALVRVPLSKSDNEVILYQEDFDRLYQAGLDPRWKLMLGQVYTRGRKKTCIARLILDGRKGEKIQYLDGNPLNLKRDNLLSARGAGKHNSLDSIKLRPANVSITHTYI